MWFLSQAMLFVIDSNQINGGVSARLSFLVAKVCENTGHVDLDSKLLTCHLFQILSDTGPRKDVDTSEMLKRFQRGLQDHGSLPETTALFANAIHCVTFSTRNQVLESGMLAFYLSPAHRTLAGCMCRFGDLRLNL
jgi:hypothetical protein